ncbi:unnamed protein product [Dibothriocephalus latus]|uniref:Uncharacterized protein n=1 Tax=Dibothriocephalus latus TaxID=60516 RepID=A0A3P6SUA4_DIBLA|nr:unnamed protein product [Dibothriocephalus latus]
MKHKCRLVIPRTEQDTLGTPKADKKKGRSMVALGKAQYLQKPNALFADYEAYHKPEGNMIQKSDTQLKSTGTVLKDNVSMTSAELNEVAMARLYGLPQFHKDGALLRPTVLLRGTPKFNLAKGCSNA